MTIKKYLFIFLLFGSSLSMADENDKPKDAIGSAAAPAEETSNIAAPASASAENESEEAENAEVTDPWMDHPAIKWRWNEKFRKEQLEKEEQIRKEQERNELLKNEEQKRDQALKKAKAEKDGKERVVGGAGPSGS